MIDGSGSIPRGYFNGIKTFIKQLYRGFRVGFDETHVGAVIYSSKVDVKKVFGLQSYYDYQALDKAIDDMMQPSGVTYTGCALKFAKDQVYTPSHDRADISNVCIVITDGISNDDIGPPADALRKQGTAIFAIGVGANYDRAELERMAGTSRNVYTAAFSELDTVIDEIKQSACKGW